MNRFINADGLHINVDFIKTYWTTKDGTLHIELGDDDVRVIPRRKQMAS